MSEKAEQNAPERCSCCTCGYTWVKGQYGGHSCAQVMEVTVAEKDHEIERLTSQLEHWLSLDKQRDAELAALKAQPGGVVHHNLIEALKFYANGDHLLLADPDAWDTCSGEPINFLHDDAGTASVEDGSIAKAALDSLNSSPVSAGDRETLRYLMDRFDNEVWVCQHCSHEETTSDMDSASYLREYLAGAQHASAGGVDEREEFEAWAKTRNLSTVKYAGGMYVCDRTMWAEIAWIESRAALSAPSHGEQVREGWQLVPFEPTREMISAASGAITTPDDLPPVGAGRWSMSDIAFRSRYRAALAAAPSPASQKEQGE